MQIISKSTELESESLIIGIKNEPTTQAVLRYMVASSKARPANVKYEAGPAAPLWNKGFHALPPELRQMIFRMVLEWNGKTPALLKALRPDQLLYEEALHLFFQINPYNLERKNGWSFEEIAGTKRKTVESVYRLNILIA